MEEKALIDLINKVQTVDNLHAIRLLNNTLLDSGLICIDCVDDILGKYRDSPLEVNFQYLKIKISICSLLSDHDRTEHLTSKYS